MRLKCFSLSSRLLLTVLFFATDILISGCNKPEPSVQEEATTLTVINTDILPGDVVEVKVNKKVSVKEVEVLLDSTKLRGYIKGDSAYVFLVPVLNPGTYSLSIPQTKSTNTVTLTVVKYDPITNPQVVLDEYVKKRNQSIDSLTKYESSNSPFKPSAATLTLLSQLKEEWDLQLAKLTTSEKELLSYVMARNMTVPTDYKFDTLPAKYYARLANVQGDAGDLLMAKAKVYTTTVISCVATIPGVLATGAGFIYMPSPITGSIFLAVWTTHLILKEMAAFRGQEVARMKGIVEAITDVTTQRIQAETFTNNTEKIVKMSVGYRNLVQADAGINADFSSAFSSDKNFADGSKQVQDIFNRLTSLMTKLKGAYSAYQPLIGNTPVASMSLPVSGADIIVKGVSDNRISFSTTLSGNDRKIKISSNSAVDINFNLTLAYVRKLDGKEITKVIPCVFKAPQLIMTKVSGDEQSAPPTFSLVAPLKVEVKTADGRAVTGITVLWKIISGGGQLLLSSTTTDGTGGSTNGWQVGASGMQVVSAEVKYSDGTQITNSPVSFTATIIEPHKLTYISGDGQSGSPNTILSNPIIVEVRDVNGAAIKGMNVRWSVLSGGGQLGASYSLSDINGKASNTWKLGTSGTQQLTVSVIKSDGTHVIGSPIVVSAYVTAECSNPSTFTDTRDGKIYKTVQIGSQVWMAENLNYATGKSRCYDNNSSNCNVYGRLYDWETAKNACPSGWHLPTVAEWKNLIKFLDPTADTTQCCGNTAGGKMKSMGTQYWQSPNADATNSSCFSGLPGGDCYFSSDGSSASFNLIGEYGYWWSSTDGGGTSNYAWAYILSSGSNGFPQKGASKLYGHSVRCLRD
jgi:uncharacterized protein (TIGR02145 family)